ncbi:ABC transporter permease [Gluconobacter sp.]|uniref:ABC transporter permease n=1 Tax=Gluconobacter sp. TaxID=1876758 RepID=UPI0039ECA009
MFADTLRATWRTLSGQKRYTLLNLSGLALGIAVFLTMALIVRYENSYDTSFPNPSRLYVVDEAFRPAGHAPADSDFISFVPFPFLKQDFPEINAAIRLMQETLVVRAGKTLAQERVTMTDPDFFSVFELPLLVGDRSTALDGPGKVVISTDMARKYFGTEQALGKRLRIDNGQAEAIVTGILAPQPPNQTMKFDFIEIIPTSWLSKYAFTNWGSMWGTIWTRIDDPRAIPRIRAGLAHYPYQHPGHWTKDLLQEMFGSGGLDLLPLKELHFHAADIGEGGNSRTLVHILGLIGLAALATAIINYVNLATARSALRAREVAVRKVLGATRPRLIAQFMTEAYLMVMIAAALGTALTELALRWVNLWGGWDLSMDWSFILAVSTLVVLVAGTLAGFYPALVISGFRPAAVLAASKTPAGGRIESGLRSLLVVLQFSFAMTLAICSLVMDLQAQHVRTLDRGMTQDGLIIIPSLDDSSLVSRQKEIIARLAQVPGVRVATRSDIYPYNAVNNEDWLRVGHSEKHSLNWGRAAEGYFDAMGAHLLAGRFFDTHHGQDYPSNPFLAGNGTSVILSRLAAERLGFASPQDAIGKDVQEAGSPQTYNVIGVIDDIRIHKASAPMRPLLFMGASGSFSYIGGLIRYNGATAQLEMNRLAKAWAEVAPDVAFSAQTASDIFADDYRSDESHGALFGIGSTVAIGIACLGLYGLSAFNVSRRRQEIGIRKVLGAGTRDVLRLLLTQFLRPVVFASLIAWPAAWGLMRIWLSSFDDRISLTPLPFLGVTAAAIIIAILTIIAQTRRIAKLPPAIALHQSG